MLPSGHDLRVKKTVPTPLAAAITPTWNRIKLSAEGSNISSPKGRGSHRKLLERGNQLNRSIQYTKTGIYRGNDVGFGESTKATTLKG